jgi:hypothetical protein
MGVPTRKRSKCGCDPMDGILSISDPLRNDEILTVMHDFSRPHLLSRIPYSLIFLPRQRSKSAFEEETKSHLLFVCASYSCWLLGSIYGPHNVYSWRCYAQRGGCAS